eukprot:SAG31_NODE_21686_length_543_cov_1.069820_2_plen_118_part_01
MVVAWCFAAAALAFGIYHVLVYRVYHLRCKESMQRRSVLTVDARNSLPPPDLEDVPVSSLVQVSNPARGDEDRLKRLAAFALAEYGAEDPRYSEIKQRLLAAQGNTSVEAIVDPASNA